MLPKEGVLYYEVMFSEKVNSVIFYKRTKQAATAISPVMIILSKPNISNIADSINLYTW
jgi:hypothetical protein